MKYLALILLAVLQVILNLVLWRKRHSRVSRIFTFFTGILLVWTVTNGLLDYVVNTPHLFSNQTTRLHVLNITNQIGFFSGTFILVLLYQLILVFPTNWKRTRATSLITSFGALLAVVSLLPPIAGTYTLGTSEVPLYHYGKAYVLIALYFVLIVGIAVQKMIISLRQPIDPLIRLQAKTILSGLLMTGLWAITFILILPAIVGGSGSETVLFIGYFAPYIFTGVILYSIFKQGFLNYKAIVARSIGYVLSLGCIAILFMMATLTVIRILSGDSINAMEALIFASFNVLTALAFPSTKRFFDRITNKVFYHDAYDAQELLDSLNRLFVANTDLGLMLQQSANIIENHLKAEFCYFSVKSVQGVDLRFIGHHTRQLSEADVQYITTNVERMHSNIIATDELGPKHEQLRQLMQENDIALLGRLATSSRRNADSLGYLVLGQRRSGNRYTIQDLRILEIIVNELVIAAENSLRFEEIQHFNETLQQNVSDATRKLRRTNEKLQDLDATKDEFITMASHQLRTPLTSVKGYLSMVLEGDAGTLNAQQKQLLTQSFISAQRMVFLISDLLNLSRLNTGKFVIESTPTDLRAVVQAEIDQLSETAKSRDIVLGFDVPAEFPKLMLDETKIHQVVMNFIDNAIYYTPSGGEITISLHETPTAVEYLVKDTGIGVPKPEQHKLFTKFYRADNARRARPDGTGLGLFMAKKVIAAQGGAIIFESEEGKGSTFGFRFSKAHHLAPSAPTPVTAKV